MKLTLKDRVLILNSVLPLYDSMTNTKIKMSVIDKLAITNEEQSVLVINQMGNGQVEIALKNPEKNIEAWNSNKEYQISDEELFYLQKRVEMIDQNGMFSIDTIETYEKILNEESTSKDS